MNVIAIDFETANYDPASACAMGLAFIERGRVVRVEHRFINPPPGRFAFTWLHGIARADVKDAPDFAEVWREFRFAFKDALLLAHNASFDLNVIRAAKRHYRMRTAPARSLCTLGLSRAVWPGLRSKSLAHVARHLGIALRHHQADEDARACAEIALAAARETGVPNVRHLPERLGLPLARL